MVMELGLGYTKGPSDSSSDLEPRAIGSGGPKGRSLRHDKGPFPPLTLSERAGNCQPPACSPPCSQNDLSGMKYPHSLD